MEATMQPAPDQSRNLPQERQSGAASDADTSFRCLHFRAHDLLCELVRAAEGAPGTFQRDYHTGLAGKRLAEIADGLGFDLVTRIPVDADDDSEPEGDGIDPAEMALERGDLELMRHYEDMA
jgi:hypothetical protein